MLFDVAAGFIFYLVASRLGVRISIFWTLLAVLSSHAFLFRVSLLRIQSVFLTNLLLGFLLFKEKRKSSIYLVSIISVWLYDGFPLLMAMAMALAFSVSEWFIERRIEIKAPLVCFCGILMGLVLNPYFPEDIQSMVYNLSRTILLNVSDVELGSEWAPYSTWGVLKSSGPGFVFLCVTILYSPFIKRPSVEEYASIILNLLFLFLTFKARRFVEYWPVFAMLSSALIVGRRVSLKIILPCMMLFLPILFINIKNVTSEIRTSISPKTYEGDSLWLKEQSNEGDIVFNADWDDLPFLFFYNSKNHYILGLDPMYMYTYDRDRYRLYGAITRGKITRPGSRIIKEFNARFIFLDRLHPEFYRTLQVDPNVEKVYEDGGAFVFEVVDSYGIK